MAWLQNHFASRRFQQELQQQREIALRERRRMVRDEPLVTLRKELARMAAKNQRLVSISMMLHTAIPAPPKDTVEAWIENARKDFNDYIDSGQFQQALFAIDDKEILDRVEQLERDCRRAFWRNVMFEKLSVDEQVKTLTQSKELADQVREIQFLALFQSYVIFVDQI